MMVDRKVGNPVYMSFVLVSPVKYLVCDEYIFERTFRYGGSHIINPNYPSVGVASKDMYMLIFAQGAVSLQLVGPSPRPLVVYIYDNTLIVDIE